MVLINLLTSENYMFYYSKLPIPNSKFSGRIKAKTQKVIIFLLLRG
jgi:hypothetical protein